MDPLSVAMLPYHHAGVAASQDTTFQINTPNRADDSIDRLLGEKSRVLKVKLEVLAAEISERLQIRSLNLYRILQDELILDNLLIYFDPSTASPLYRPNFPEKLYQEKLGLSEQRRQQDVECWRDVVMVMRDFLTVWESVELSKSKAIFLADDRESN